MSIGPRKIILTDIFEIVPSLLFIDFRPYGKIRLSSFLTIRPYGQKFGLPVFLRFGLPDSA